MFQKYISVNVDWTFQMQGIPASTIKVGDDNSRLF